MSTVLDQRPAGEAPPGAPATIKAVPVRHPGRWVSSAIVLLFTGMFVHMLVTNPAFQWRFMWQNMFKPPVLHGARTSLVMTVLAMALGVALGIVIAVMRLSPNPILSRMAWVYTWVFRSLPRVVLLVTFGTLGVLYKRFEFGIPFDRQIASFLGIDLHARYFGVSANTLLTGFMAGLLGLALSEAAYMAEIVRAGILSVDEGQTEAAAALGMTRLQTLRRIVLPQAMRIIVPPTGNETIAMLKDTALLAYVPVYDLWFQLQAIGNRTFRPFPMYVAASIWYIVMTSILMVGQYFLERRYARGTRRTTRREIRQGRKFLTAVRGAQPG